MASHLTQDQNLSMHFDAAGVKKPIVQKNKGLGGRKANFGKPPALQPSRKHNVIPSSQKQKQKQQEGGGLKKKTQQQPVDDEKQLPFSIAEEGFLHNHDECIKSQKNMLMDFSEWLKIIGLDKSDTCVSASNNSPNQAGNHMMIFDMEKILEPMILSPISGSPKSPKLADMMSMEEDFVQDFDPWVNNSPNFVLTESPKRSK